MKLKLTTSLKTADAAIARATKLVLAKDAAKMGIDPGKLSKRLEELKKARGRILKKEFAVLRAVHDLDSTVASGLGWPEKPLNNPLADLLKLLDAVAAPTSKAAAGVSSSSSLPLSYFASSSSVSGGNSLSWSFPPGSSGGAHAVSAPGAKPQPPPAARAKKARRKRG